MAPASYDEEAPITLDRSYLWVVFSLVFGLTVGLLAPSDYDVAILADPWATVSHVLGWMYFFCWSASFWPQIVLNYQRKCTRGLSLDYQVLNFLRWFTLSPTTPIHHRLMCIRGTTFPGSTRVDDVLWSIIGVRLSPQMLTTAVLHMPGAQSGRLRVLRRLQLRPLLLQHRAG
jgi:uncharacterized membrane protein YhaH (DUF805 family)